MEALPFATGCFAGVAGVLISHPLDTLKIRLQLQSTTNNTVYKSAINCLKSIIQKEGPRALYKGVTPPIVTLAAINALIFGVEKNALRQMEGVPSLRNPIIAGSLAGSIAGLVQSVIICPMELVKTQMQMQGVGVKYGSARVYSSPFQAVTKIYGAEGIRGLYRGMGSTVVREVPSFAVYFGTFELLKILFTPQGAERCPWYMLLVAGGLAGSNSWLYTYPLDVIKSRFQGDGVWKDGKMSYKYASFRHCARQSLVEEGYRVFSRGLGITLIRAFPHNAAILGIEEILRRNLTHKESSDDTDMI